MFKIALTGLIYLVLFAGCATRHKLENIATEVQKVDDKNLLMRVEGKNLTANGFYIQKGKILSISESGRISLYFTMKYNSEGKYIISLRSKAGMEAFRVYLSRDTILVNDRLKRNILYGNPGDFEKITGIPVALLKISVGDLFMNRPSNSDGTNCKNNELKLYDYLLGLSVNSTIDCKEAKVKSMIVSTGEPDQFISINYFKFRDDNYSVPKRIEINDAGRKIRIIISIEKYLCPWLGDIDFIPGEGYQSKPLI